MPGVEPINQEIKIFDKAMHFSKSYSHATLHGLRVFAIITILSNHWAEQFYSKLIPQQQIAIDFFLAIEGFLFGAKVSRTLITASWWSTMKQRLGELYPLYVVSLLAGAALVLPLAFSQSEDWTAELLQRAVLNGLVGLPTFSPAMHGSVFPLNPPSWAIVAEVAVFAAFLGMRAHLHLRVLLSIYGIAAAALLIWSVLARDNNLGWQSSSYWGAIPRAVFGFSSGMIIRFIVLTYGAKIPRVNSVVVLVGFIGVLFVDVRYVGLPLLVVAVPLIVGLAATASCPTWLGVLSCWGGRNANALYLLHYPILVMFLTVGTAAGLSNDNMSSWYIWILLLIVVLIASIIVQFIVNILLFGSLKMNTKGFSTYVD